MKVAQIGNSARANLSKTCADWSKSANTDPAGLFPNEICDSYYYIVNQSCTTLYIGAKAK